MPDLASMTGMEQLQAMVDGLIPPAPIAETLGMVNFGGEEGSISVELVPELRHYNPLGTVHGGVLSTLLDTAAACSVHSTLAPGEGYTSLDLTVKFLRPATEASGRLRAVGRVVSRGRRTATCLTRRVPRLRPMSAETSQTLDRGLRVLEVLAGSPGGLTVTELAGRLGVNRTVVYRLVSTLEQHALLRRDAKGRLHIGLGILHLAGAVQPVLRDLAQPVLRRLAEKVGCTAHLTVVEGAEALALAVVEPSWTDFHVSYRVGTRHPLAQGAAGKAVLLGRSAGGRAPAYVTTTGELQTGARGLAAPVRKVDGLEASVGIVTLGVLDESVVAPQVVAAADEVAAVAGAGDGVDLEHLGDLGQVGADDVVATLAGVGRGLTDLQRQERGHRVSQRLG